MFLFSKAGSVLEAPRKGGSVLEKGGSVLEKGLILFSKDEGFYSPRGLCSGKNLFSERILFFKEHRGFLFAKEGREFLFCPRRGAFVCFFLLVVFFFFFLGIFFLFFFFFFFFFFFLGHCDSFQSVAFSVSIRFIFFFGFGVGIHVSCFIIHDSREILWFMMYLGSRLGLEKG